MASASTSSGILAGQSATVPARRVEILRGIPEFNDDRLAERFINEDRALTLRNVRNLCWIAMMLVPSAVVLDWFAYRHLLAEFALLRLACCLCLLPIALFTRTEASHRYYRALTVIVPMTPAFFISLMIKIAHDPGSSYYAGLTLCLVAIGFMFHWTFRESVMALSLTMIFYIAANWEALMLGVSEKVLGAFANNCFFILLNGVVILCGSFYHHRIRVREFLNRIEVEEQREELTSRNQELTATLQQLHATESQLFQSDKLASLGRMSAGIIHEINNPLNFANQALFVLKRKGKLLPEDSREDFDRIIADIKEGIARVSSIVTDLRCFSHPVSDLATEVDVNDAVHNSLRLMSKDIKDNEIEVKIEVPDCLHIMGDRNQLVQVLINLIQNAVGAMKDRQEKLITIRGAVEANRITLKVEDKGCGIPPENLSKVFEPFFTTKDVGEGMGLGLSVCYRLMEQMHGGIQVESEPGKGTTFTLWFPPFTQEHDA